MLSNYRIISVCGGVILLYFGVDVWHLNVSSHLNIFCVQDLNSRLKKLINAAPVILFMKGTPDEPRCGE